MKKTFIALCVAAVISVPSIALADKVSDAERKKIQTTLDKISKVAGKPLTIDAIATTPVPGLYQVTSDLSIFYVSADGKYVFSGEMIDASKDPKEWSITEHEMRQVRKDALAKLTPNDFIAFPATAKKIGVVYVFTDVECHFCQKLQENIKDYTDKGIEIRYLSFPRQGIKSTGFDKAVSVWCAKDRNAAYAKAIEGKDIENNQCKDNPVKSDFELGLKLAVRGTPTLIFENGQKVGGLIDPAEMVKIIQAK